MAKFSVEVTRTDVYEIEIDETIWDAAALKDWSETFHKVTTIKEFLKSYAISFMKADDTSFIEGYGYVKELKKDGEARKVHRCISGKFSFLPEDDFTVGLTIKPLIQDDDYDVDLTEIKG